MTLFEMSSFLEWINLVVAISNAFWLRKLLNQKICDQVEEAQTVANVHKWLHKPIRVALLGLWPLGIYISCLSPPVSPLMGMLMIWYFLAVEDLPPGMSKFEEW